MPSESLILIRKLHERAEIFKALDHDLADNPDHVILARKFYALVEEAYQISIKLNDWADDPKRRFQK